MPYHRRRRSVRVPTSAFAGFRFPPEVITLAVRWYLRFGLSYRDVEELLAERGVHVDHVTVYRWVQRFAPLLAEAARPARHAVGDRWHVDETYVKISGTWQYLYRRSTSSAMWWTCSCRPRGTREPLVASLRRPWRAPACVATTRSPGAPTPMAVRRLGLSARRSLS